MIDDLSIRLIEIVNMMKYLIEIKSVKSFAPNQNLIILCHVDG